MTYPFTDHRTVAEVDQGRPRRSLSIAAARALPVSTDPQAEAYRYHSERLSQALVSSAETLAAMAADHRRWAALAAKWTAMTPAEAAAFVESGEYRAMMSANPRKEI